MTRSVTIDGVEVTWPRLDFNLGSTAYRGEVGTGSLKVDDPDQTEPIEPYLDVKVTDSEASPTLIFRGFTAERFITREDSMVTGGERQWDVTLEDLNVMLSDRLIGSSGKRGEETDYQRVKWLLGEGSLADIAAGQVPNSNTKSMGGEDYRGRPAVEVLEDCSQRTGKNYYVFDDGSGRQLFYDKQRNSTVSTIEVSDVASDLTANVLSPVDLDVTVDPARQFHEVLLKYDGGSIRGRQAVVPSPRRKEKVVTNRRIKTRARAQDHLDNLLDQVEKEAVDVAFSILLPAAKAGSIRAGQQMWVRLAHAGIPRTKYKVKAVHVGPKGDDKKDYLVRLEMADRIRPTHVTYSPDVPSANTGGTEKGQPVPPDTGTEWVTVDGWLSWDDWTRCQ